MLAFNGNTSNYFLLKRFIRLVSKTSVPTAEILMGLDLACGASYKKSVVKSVVKWMAKTEEF
jgi:hypothetical protein